MSKWVVSEHINIDHCPLPERDVNITDISIGDLHSNAIKLLYFLVRNAICKVLPSDYQRLVDIYRTTELTAALLTEFNVIVTRMEIINQNVLVRLMGDEMGDRGSNDYFILCLLQKLVQGKANIIIVLSNHGAEFIDAYEQYALHGHVFKATLLNPLTLARSLTGLGNIVTQGLITSNDVMHMIETSYKPLLRVLSYSLDSKTHGITVFSHAGIGLASIRELAHFFEIQYNDHTSIELATTIDGINKAFVPYVASNTVHTLFSRDEMSTGYKDHIVFSHHNALEFIIWNRSYSSLERPAVHNGYPLSFVHGHDKEKIANNIYGLDTELGKSPTQHSEWYVSLGSNEKQRT